MAPARPRILVLEDDALLARALVTALRTAGMEAINCGSMAEAEAVLVDGVDCAIIDVFLGAEPVGIAAAEVAKRAPAPPAVVAISGYAGPLQGYHLGRVGVDAFLTKPVQSATLVRTICDLLGRRDELSARDRRLPQVVERIKRRMLLDALRSTGGNKTSAARMLGISRQALQNMLRRGLLEPGEIEPSEKDDPRTD